MCAPVFLRLDVNVIVFYRFPKFFYPVEIFSRKKERMNKKTVYICMETNFQKYASLSQGTVIHKTRVGICTEALFSILTR